jgi:hypothetical protein
VTLDFLDINGQEPPLIGLSCERMVAIEYSHAGEVIEPANVVSLLFSGQWYRLYFDGVTIFWRESSDEPESFAAEEWDATFRAVELAQCFRIQGEVLIGIDYKHLPAGVGVHLRFKNGQLVKFECEHDVTHYSASNVD